MAGKTGEIDQGLIRDLAGILNDTDLTEIEVEQGDLRVRVSRQGSMPMMAPQVYAAPQPQAAPLAAAPAAAAPAAANNANAVPSPMVGTVYFAPAPGADAFVSIGSKVKEGQTILIIEAMKTMNQIAAPRSGTVTAILVDDAAPVEYGQSLLVIE
ncbi:MAG: acetyl-CoA carboxylase biotin carboxyl carrier protein [Rhizobiaceae bacterium]